MGCTSSTEAVTNPHTGETKPKHKGGGAYPGNRRTPQQAYAPPASEFNSQGQATAHFVSYGGGNALVLQQGGIAQPTVGQKQPQYVQVTLPAGVEPGQAIHVQAPDGQINEIIIPDGFGPGSTFTVEFADAAPTKTTTNTTPQTSYPTAPAVPQQQQTYNNNNNTQHHDDGFATGFNNPGFTPTAPPTTTTAATTGYDAEIDLTSYPAASDAKPVYSSGPTYNATAY